MNKSDSERIASVLEKIGYKKTLKIKEADLIVINMCSVRQSAVDRVYSKIQNLKCKIILTGCILKKDKENLSRQVNLILDIKDLDKNYLAIKPKRSNNFSALVPISNGCNNFCSYCVVPYVRGPLVCRDHREILGEVKNAVKNDFKEIWLLGQNVNDYWSRDVNFAKLLKMVNDIPGKFWIRFTSPHPKNFSDELIKTMAKCQKLTPYLNLPIQSGDNEILKRMNRPYTTQQYNNLVKKIRKKIPNIFLSTDIIVGFPGETKKQFENTVKLFKDIKFDMAYIAKYSSRPGTAAEKMADDIPQKEKKGRWKVLTEILKKTALEKNKKYLGKTVEVLPTEWKPARNASRSDAGGNGFLIGKSFHYRTVKFKGSKNLIGQFIKVKIINADSFGLSGIIS